MSTPTTTTASDILVHGVNGNAIVTVYADGTRQVSYPEEGMQLDCPLNVDIRFTNRCRFGRNESTGKAVCSFCHESATVNGAVGDLDTLLRKLLELPTTTEIAIGINYVDDSLIGFLRSLRQAGYVVSGTVNQGLIRTGDADRLFDADVLYGVGVSFRKLSWMTDHPIYSDANTVIHTIAGIDQFSDVLQLVTDFNCQKILVLGEKDFGFNQGNVNTNSPCHRDWYRQLLSLIRAAEVTSFDNLALQQLNVRRFLSAERWERFYQHENSLYINAVSGTYSPSSRSFDTTSWDNLSIEQYWRTIRVR